MGTFRFGVENIQMIPCPSRIGHCISPMRLNKYTTITRGAHDGRTGKGEPEKAGIGYVQAIVWESANRNDNDT